MQPSHDPQRPGQGGAGALAPAELERVLDPVSYMWLAGEFVDRVVTAAARTVR